MPASFQCNPAMLIDLYELTMAQVYLENNKNTLATFDLFIRNMPECRSYFVAAGLEPVLDYLKGLKFGDKDLSYLRGRGLFSAAFLSYLKRFKFRGDVWAVPEGTVVFPQEPILRITAPLIEAQIIESFLLNAINIHTTLLTKASRVVMASQGKPVVDFALRRTHGQDAALTAARSAYIAGCCGTSNVLAGMRYRVPVVGTMAHAFVLAFDQERESFRAFSRTFPDNAILLIDTYDNIRGAENAISVAEELARRGHRLIGVRIDSGDLASISRKVRCLLDERGLDYVKIIASGNLDEYKIARLLKQKAPIDSFGVGTNMGTSADLPFCDVSYKISEVEVKPAAFSPRMKLSQDKNTLPGRKQVFRRFDKNGRFLKDIIGLADENIPGTRKLLLKVMSRGKIIYQKPGLDKIRGHCRKNINNLPQAIKQIKHPRHYEVKLSPRLRELTFVLSRAIAGAKVETGDLVFVDIDTQFDFMRPQGRLYVPGAEKLIGRLKKLTAFAGGHNIPIIASMDKHRVNDPEFKQFPAHCLAKTAGQKKIGATSLTRKAVLPYARKGRPQHLKKIMAENAQIVLEKCRLSIFSNPNARLLFKGVTRAFVYGVATEYCVRECGMGLLNMGIDTCVIKDAVAAVDKDKGINALRELKAKGAKIITTDEALRGLIRPADSFCIHKANQNGGAH